MNLTMLNIALLLGCLVALMMPIESMALESKSKREKVMDMVVEEAIKANFPPALALAVAKIESNFNARALSHAGARGVMQIMPKTAWDEYGVSADKLYNPRVNIHYGIKFLQQLLKRYDNYVDLALSHYNGGSRVKGAHGVLRVIPATRGYVSKVIEQRIEFQIHPKVMVVKNQLSPRQQPKAVNYTYVRDLDDFAVANHRIRHLLAKRQQQQQVKQKPPTPRQKLVAKLRDLREHNAKRKVAKSVSTKLPIDLETKADKKALVASWESY